MNSDKHIDDEITGAGNGVEYAQVGGRKKRVNKSKRKSILRKMKKNKTMKRKTVKRTKGGKRKSKK